MPTYRQFFFMRALVWIGSLMDPLTCPPPPTSPLAKIARYKPPSIPSQKKSLEGSSYCILPVASKVEAWGDWESDGDESPPDYLCLLCDSRFDSTENLFNHCESQHFFDFHGMVRDLGLDFYGSMKLINYIRSQVAENKDVQAHLHELVRYEKNGKLVWDDDVYLKPFIVDDALLHSFLGDDDDDDDDCSEMISREQVMEELAINGDMAEKEEAVITPFLIQPLWV